ncbi:hypothetical protein [Marinomonas flavescens]|uniref:hypothetical protein n=1 Tax=Marinomonas flavescens TaxID=2529379 RepID=UPI001054E069|nr:hypothetical protein [Marinomonas flavescens]
MLRLKSDVDRELIELACVFARTQIGKQYSLKDAIKTKNPLSKKIDTNRQFCSRLVAQSYEFAGLNLVDNGSFCTPQELDDSVYTYRVNDCLRDADTVEVDFAKSDSPLKSQANITNSILKEARKIVREDIQTYEQLINYVCSHPKYDKEITSLVENSGYLLMWQYDLKVSSWRYDLDIFLNIQESGLYDIASQELESAKNIRSRHVYMYKQFLAIWQVRGLKFAEINLILYLKLIELTNQRITVATSVLERIK